MPSADQLQEAYAAGERIEFTSRHGEWRKWSPCCGITLGRDDRQWRIAPPLPPIDLTVLPFPFYHQVAA